MYPTVKEEAERILSQEWGITDLPVRFEVPPEEAYGDTTTTVAFPLGKRLRKRPEEIAGILAERLQRSSLVERAEVAGEGFVNVRLKAQTLLQEFQRTREACTPKVTREERPVIVEYSDPNIAKPLGVHHLLATIIGQAIANMYRFAGYPVLSWNYLGDWGTQFGNLAVACEKWGSGKPASEYSLDELLALYVRFYKEAQRDPSLEDAGREAFRKLEQGGPELWKFWEGAVAVTKTSLKVLYERLHIRFDVDEGESFYNDKMGAVLTEGKQKGVFTVGEKGALIVEFPRETGLPVYMVLKSDGSTLYATRDIAQIRYRIDTYHPQSILYVVDTAQTLYFRQLFETVRRLQWELPHLEHVVFGRMRFKDRAMSTRMGNILTLEEVLDEAVRRADQVIEEHRDTVQTDDRAGLAEMMGLGAIAYAILSQNRRADIVFDWDRMLTFEGSSAPYLQYTHARARSVLRKAGEEGERTVPRIETLTGKERVLLRTLLQFSEVLAEALQTHMPHKLAQYLFTLCQAYNAFYNTEPILKSTDPSRTLRLALTARTAATLKTGAELLTIRVPDRM